MVADAGGYDIFFRACDGKGNYPLQQTAHDSATISYTIEGLKKGRKLKLTDKIKPTPAGATSACTWISSDPGIATVSAKGVVKGVKKGTVTIIVTTANGLTAQTKVKVK